MEKARIGIVGLGAISGVYLKNIKGMFKELELVAVCDILEERAKKVAEEHDVPNWYVNMEDLFADPNVDIVLNLTRPFEHFEVSSKALNAGKHVYTEKPLGATLEESEKLVKLAKEKGLMLGGAPDTYLGAGIQTCRKLIDDGFIGDIVAVSCHMLCRGHERWHPAPEFYYQFGGGPMMDMGPYYITALVNLVGGVKSVVGVTKTSYPERTITSQAKFGEKIIPEVPTHYAGIMNFDNGAVGTIVMSFDVHSDSQASIIVYGSKGTLYVPNPNTFGPKAELLRPEHGEKMEIPLCFDYKENARGLGLADMAKAFMTNRECRVDGNQALHVMEVLTSFERSNASGSVEMIKNKFEIHEPMKNNLMSGVLD